IVGFPRARLITESQATLLQFLKRVVELLLDGLPASETTSTSKWGELMASALKAVADGAGWSDFVNQPFTGPPRFDVDALVGQVRLRFDVTSDPLWLLQTEPSYLKRYMRKIAQMQTVESTGRKRAGLAIIDGELNGDVDLHWFWYCTLSEIENVQKLYRRYRDSIARGSPMPKK
ncbi:hypothetical protein BDW02DRAFT_460654, partial [Decorospora gaudefroyi]